MKIPGFSAVILSAALAGPLSGATPPNVLFIAVDDLNDWVGALGGHPQAKTPNIDRLAARGLLFTRAYTAAPLCNPSRTSLLCGVRPSTSGVYRNTQPWRAALPHAVTLSQHFMAHGYTAAGCGKIFHGGFNDQASWNEYMTRAGGSLPRGATAPRGGSEPGSGPAAAEEAPARRNRGEGLVRLAWTPLDVTDGETSDGRVVDWAAGFLARRHDKPFFLAVGLQRPHLPWNVPRKYFALFPPAEVKLPQVKADDLDDVPAPGRGMANPEGDHRQLVESGKFQEAVAAYLASIAFADAQIGSLLDALEKSPYAANTIVIFFGDHGWHLGEKLHWRKLTLWEEATRVPLILAAPGVTRPGERCERTVSLLDLYPTLCELCNLGPGKNLEGQSLVPLLRNPAAAWQRPAVTTCFHQNHAVRSERWRYIRYADGSEELYDHDKDPLEWTNLAADPALAAVKKELAGWLPRVNAEESKTPAGGETVKPKGL